MGDFGQVMAVRLLTALLQRHPVVLVIPSITSKFVLNYNQQKLFSVAFKKKLKQSFRGTNHVPPQSHPLRPRGRQDTDVIVDDGTALIYLVTADWPKIFYSTKTCKSLFKLQIQSNLIIRSINIDG